MAASFPLDALPEELVKEVERRCSPLALSLYVLTSRRRFRALFDSILPAKIMLLLSAEDGHYEIFKYLLERFPTALTEEVSVETRSLDVEGFTGRFDKPASTQVIPRALRYSQLNFISKILAEYPECGGYKMDQWKAILEAAYSKDLETFELAIKFRFDPSDPNELQAVQFRALQTKNLDVFRIVYDVCKRVPSEHLLIYACLFGTVAIVKYLMSLGVIANIARCCWAAAKGGNEDIIDILVPLLPDVGNRDFTLISAFASGHLRDLSQLNVHLFKRLQSLRLFNSSFAFKDLIRYCIFSSNIPLCEHLLSMCPDGEQQLIPDTITSLGGFYNEKIPTKEAIDFLLARYPGSFELLRLGIVSEKIPNFVGCLSALLARGAVLHMETVEKAVAARRFRFARALISIALRTPGLEAVVNQLKSYKTPDPAPSSGPSFEAFLKHALPLLSNE